MMSWQKLPARPCHTWITLLEGENDIIIRRQARRHGGGPPVGGDAPQMKILLYTVKFKALKPLKDILLSCQCDYELSLSVCSFFSPDPIPGHGEGKRVYPLIPSYTLPLDAFVVSTRGGNRTEPETEHTELVPHSKVIPNRPERTQRV